MTRYQLLDFLGGLLAFTALLAVAYGVLLVTP